MSIDHVERGPRFRQPSRRRMRAWIVVGIFLGFVALAWAWAFQRGPSHGAGSDIPVLAADGQPTREKPTDPGGMKVADIDPLAYDSGRSPPRVENILPAPEKPLPQPTPDQHSVAAAPPAATDAAPANDGIAGKLQQVADAGMLGPPVRLVPAAAPPPPIKPARMVAVPPPAAKPVPKAKPVAAREPAAPHPEVKSKAKPVVAGVGGYRLQLASVRSEADARTVEAKLRRSYGDVLGATGFAIVPVSLGARGTYYRIMAGPMNQGSASQLCDTLRRRGAACILAKP